MIPLFNLSLRELKTPRLLKPRINLLATDVFKYSNLEPGPYKPPQSRALAEYLDKDSQFQPFVFADLQKEFWDVGIQVIVKLSSIHLSPEQPEYAGKPWHVQGQLVCTQRSVLFANLL